MNDGVAPPAQATAIAGACRYVKWALAVAIASSVMAVLIGLGGFALGLFTIFSPNVVNSALGPVFGGMLNAPKPATRAVPGIANAFDPIAAYVEVKSFAGENPQLVEIEASQVRRDGTLDLTASYRPAPSVAFRFVRAVPRPDNAPPVRAGGTREGAWFEPISIDVYEPGQRRRVTETGTVNRSYTYVNEGMTRTASEPHTKTKPEQIVTAPRCKFADLWVIAANAGAPIDAVARITYDAKGYRFTIIGTKTSLAFDHACRRNR